MPDRIYEYSVTGLPRVPGSELVWCDPATGQVRDASNGGYGTKQLVIIDDEVATQTNWDGTSAVPQTTVASGSASFLRVSQPGSGQELLDAYLSHHLGTGVHRVAVRSVGGRVTLTSSTGDLSVTVTILHILAPTPELRRKLFSPMLRNITERVKQLGAGVAPPSPAIGYWLGRMWHGLRPIDAYVDSPVPLDNPRGISYGVTYGNGRVVVSSSPPHPAQAMMLNSRVFRKPVACTLADGSPAKVYEAANLKTPGDLSLGAGPDRRVANTRLLVIAGTNVTANIVGQKGDLPSLAAVCHALRVV